MALYGVAANELVWRGPPGTRLYGQPLVAASADVTVGWPVPDGGRWLLPLTWEPARAFRWEDARVEVCLGNRWARGEILDLPQYVLKIGRLPQDGEKRFIVVPREPGGAWPDAARVTVIPSGAQAVTLLFHGIVEEPFNPKFEQRVRVRILNEDGNPVPGARAALAKGMGANPAYLGTKPTIRGTNSLGEVPVRDGVAETVAHRSTAPDILLVGAPGYGLGGIALQDGAGVLQLRLGKPIAVHGRLLRADGKPAAETKIDVLKLFAPDGLQLQVGMGLYLFKTVTDKDGGFRFEGLPQGGRVRLGVSGTLRPFQKQVDGWETHEIALPRAASLLLGDVRMPALVHQ